MDMELLQSLETGNISTWMVLGVLITFSIIEIGFGFLKQSQRSKDDWTLEIISFITLSLLVKPLVLGITLFLCAAVIPDTEQALAWIPFGWACLMYLLTDDLIQYFYHRGAHAHPFFLEVASSPPPSRRNGLFRFVPKCRLVLPPHAKCLVVGIRRFLGWCRTCRTRIGHQASHHHQFT